MPEISKTAMVGKTVLRVETQPAALEVSYAEDGATVTQTVPVEGNLDDLNRRVIALIQGAKQHAQIPMPLAHSVADTSIPSGLLEY